MLCRETSVFLVCLFVFYTHQPCKHTALTPQRLLPEATTNTAQEQHEELGKEPRHPDSNVICHQNKPHPRGPPLRPKLTTLQDPKDPLHRPKTTRSIPQPVRAVHLSSFGKLFRSFGLMLWLIGVCVPPPSGLSDCARFLCICT